MNYYQSYAWCCSLGMLPLTVDNDTEFSCIEKLNISAIVILSFEFMNNKFLKSNQMIYNSTGHFTPVAAQWTVTTIALSFAQTLESSLIAIILDGKLIYLDKILCIKEATCRDNFNCNPGEEALCVELTPSNMTYVDAPLSSLLPVICEVMSALSLITIETHTRLFNRLQFDLRTK